MSGSWKTLKLLSPLEISAILALVFGGALITALSPLALRAGIDMASQSKFGLFGAGAAVFIGLYVLGQGLSRALNEAQQAYYSKAEQSAVNRQRLMLIELFLSLPLEKLTGKSSAELQQHLNNAARATSIFLQTVLLAMAPTIVQMSAIAGILGTLYNFQFLAVFLIGAVAYVWTFGRGMQIANSKQREAIRATNRISIIATDAFGHPEATKALGLEAFHSKRVHDSSSSSIMLWTDYYKFRLKNGLLIAGIFSLTFGAAILIAYLRLQAGQMSVGDFMLVSVYALQVVHPLETLGFSYRSMKQAQILVEPINELQQSISTKPADLTKLLNGEFKDITLTDVSFHYQQTGAVLNGVSLRLQKGKRTAFVGETGSGKSTVLRLILGLYKPSAGNIFFGTIDSELISLAERRSRMFAITQEPALFNCSIQENILLGSEPSRLNNAIELALLSDLFGPEGHDLADSVGERGVKLSGGQRQKIGFARIFARIDAPDFIILDEPTSSMDYQTEKRILSNVHTQFPGAGIVSVAHRLSTITGYDEIFVFDKGEVVASGTHETLLKTCSIYAELWTSQESSAIINSLS